MLAYFLKVNVAIVLFYAFYRLFFYKDTFFSWRRTALLCFFAISAVYPLLNIQTWITAQEPMVAVAELYASAWPEFTFTPQAEATTNWENIISSCASFIYWGILFILIIRFLIQLTGIIRLAFKCRTTQINGSTLYLLNRPGGPFSFFHWIFVHPASHTEEELHEILTHEQTHARQWHSIDVIVSELACILCWFNPFAWLMKREVRTNLEYMADARVLETGYDSKAYQYHLLGLSHHKAAATIYNSFNVLPLKKRIRMMNKKRTKEIGRTKYLMFLPLAALLMIFSNIETVARTTEKIATDVMENVIPQIMEQSVPATQDTTFMDKPIFEVVEKMPEFPGGMNACQKFITDNIKYPVEAKANKVQGTVYVKFVVNQDGTICDLKVLRGVSPSLDQEAIRIINSMPTWKPGMQRGIAVRVKYVMPILFDLSGKGKQLGAVSPGFDPAKAKPDANGVYEVAEQMPAFPGGIDKMMEFLSKNIQYPAEAQKEQIEGRVIIQFIVDAEGNITNPKILRGVNPLLDNEAMRVTLAMPKWIPGRQNGKAVPVKYTYPVQFKL